MTIDLVAVYQNNTYRESLGALSDGEIYKRDVAPGKKAGCCKSWAPLVNWVALFYLGQIKGHAQAGVRGMVSIRPYFWVYCTTSQGRTHQWSPAQMSGAKRGGGGSPYWYEWHKEWSRNSFSEMSYWKGSSYSDLLAGMIWNILKPGIPMNYLRGIRILYNLVRAHKETQKHRPWTELLTVSLSECVFSLRNAAFRISEGPKAWRISKQNDWAHLVLEIRGISAVNDWNGSRPWGRKCRHTACRGTWSVPH